MTWTRRLVSVGVAVVGVGGAATTYANTGINAEGVSDYSYAAAHEYFGTSNTVGAKNATDFSNGMTASGSGWTYGQLYTDSAVYDTDFCDPDVSGGDANDKDGTYFDNSGVAIGFFYGHGTCDDRTQTACTTSANCVNGICPGTPPSTHSSACISNTPRRFVVSSASSKHQDTVFYGNGHVKWGETSSSGSWGGAGTNGGMMAAIVENSCAMSQYFQSSQVINMFAGLAQLNMVLPSSNVITAGTSDDWQWTGRGSTLATYALANPSATIKAGWDASLDSAPSTTGPSCPDMTNTYTYGGGHAIGGCGGNVTIAFDHSQSSADWDVNTMTWANAKTPSLASLGNGYQANFIHCNYDCITYPFIK